MHTLDWDDNRHFLQVVQSRSATRAATRLGINHTTVYRRIAALEDRLGKSLFERSSSGWVLTPVGGALSRLPNPWRKRPTTSSARFSLTAMN